MSLHDRIMGLKVMASAASRSATAEYIDRNDSAQLAKEADELMAEMADALEDAADMLEVNNELGAEAEVRAVITKFYAYKERTQ